MNLTITLVPQVWALIADFLLLPVLFLSYYTFPRYWFKRFYNIFLAACVALMLLWAMKAGIRAGMQYHFLGATLLTLMFGWQLAILGAAIEVLVLVLQGVIQWQVFAINVFLMGVIPVTVSSLILMLVERKLYNHFIVYFFIGVFANAALTVAISVYIAAMFMVAGGAYSYEYINYEYIPYIWLMIYPEAFITGLVIIILVVYFPQWVRSFDDDKYPFGSKE